VSAMMDRESASQRVGYSALRSSAGNTAASSELHQPKRHCPVASRQSTGDLSSFSSCIFSAYYFMSALPGLRDRFVNSDFARRSPRFHRAGARHNNRHAALRLKEIRHHQTLHCCRSSRRQRHLSTDAYAAHAAPFSPQTPRCQIGTPSPFCRNSRSRCHPRRKS